MFDVFFNYILLLERYIFFDKENKMKNFISIEVIYFSFLNKSLYNCKVVIQKYFILVKFILSNNVIKISNYYWEIFG